MAFLKINTETVILVPIPGKWIPAKSVIPPNDSTNDDSQLILDAMQPLKSSKNDPKLVILSAMPATAPSYTKEMIKEGYAPVKNESSPYEKYKAKAFRSGRRSAIVPCKRSTKSDDWTIAFDNEDENIYYYPTLIEEATDLIRIKGCGMWINEEKIDLPGFTLRETESCHYKGTEKLYEIRGCAFEKTAITELYTTNKIMEMLSKINMKCGNFPLGA